MNLPDGGLRIIFDLTSDKEQFNNTLKGYRKRNKAEKENQCTKERQSKNIRNDFSWLQYYFASEKIIRELAIGYGPAWCRINYQIG